jgi:hypothetical protein
MSRPSPSSKFELDEEPDDPEEWARWAWRDLLRRYEARMDDPWSQFDQGRYLTS